MKKVTFKCDGIDPMTTRVSDPTLDSPALNEPAEREAFEAWAELQGYQLNYDAHGYLVMETGGAWHGWLARARIAAEREAAVPTDIRADGWAVAVHNDYRLNGEPHTFWLFTKGDRCVKGEGRTDAEALNQVRAALTPEKP